VVAEEEVVVEEEVVEEEEPMVEYRIQNTENKKKIQNTGGLRQRTSRCTIQMCWHCFLSSSEKGDRSKKRGGVI